MFVKNIIQIPFKIGALGGGSGTSLSRPEKKPSALLRVFLFLVLDFARTAAGAASLFDATCLWLRSDGGWGCLVVCCHLSLATLGRRLGLLRCLLLLVFGYARTAAGVASLFVATCLWLRSDGGWGCFVVCCHLSLATLGRRLGLLRCLLPLVFGFARTAAGVASLFVATCLWLRSDGGWGCFVVCCHLSLAKLGRRFEFRFCCSEIIIMVAVDCRCKLSWNPQ